MTEYHLEELARENIAATENQSRSGAPKFGCLLFHMISRACYTFTFIVLQNLM